MLTAIVVAATNSRRQIIHAAVVNSGVLSLHTALGAYPLPSDARRMFHVAEPSVVFVDLANPEAGVDFANEARSSWPRAAIIGVDPPPGVAVEGAGMAAVIAYPPNGDTVREASNRALHRIQGGPMEPLMAFLPSKAGIGCTTLVFNTATSLARLGKRVLLIECDLRSGTLTLMLNLRPEGSTQSALRALRQGLVERLSSSIVNCCGVDILASSRQAMEVLPDWSQYMELLQWASERYDAILVDFPELVNQATIELALRAKQVFLVCSQEWLPMKLAVQRLDDLQKFGVPRDRVHLIINRYHQEELEVADVEEYLKIPTYGTIPNDYRAIRRAIFQARPVPDDSPAGIAYDQLAKRLIGLPVEQSDPVAVAAPPAGDPFANPLRRALAALGDSITNRAAGQRSKSLERLDRPPITVKGS